MNYEFLYPLYNLILIFPHLLNVHPDSLHSLELFACLNQYYPSLLIILQNQFLTIENELYSLDEKIYERLLEKEMTMLRAIENNKLERVISIEDDINLIFRDLKF